MSILELKSLTKDYGHSRGLFDFSMQLNRGDIVGLIGVNGAGKTTLLDIVSGTTIPDTGEIYYEGNEMGTDTKYRKKFGISVNPEFYDYLSVYENLKAILYLNGDRTKSIINQKIRKVLKIVGLENVENKKIKEFSFGMKQRLGFAQAILNSESIMLLDEPFVGLDVSGRRMVKEYIKDTVKKSKKAVIFSDHNLEEVKSLCNRLIVINEGKKTYDGNLDIKSSIIVEVKDSDKIDRKYAEPVDDHTVKISEENINKKINHISSVTEIIKIKKIINPLEKMLEGEEYAEVN